MDDRELLQQAANAAGLDLRWSAALTQDPWSMPAWTKWNPLKDDGDAFRLAVRLQMEIKMSTVARAEVRAHGLHVEQDIGADAQAATRRAIVRAAASLAAP